MAGRQQKYAYSRFSVCDAGARQLFWSDVHSGLTNFQAMYVFIADEVALSSDRRQLDSLPMQSRAKLLAVTAAFVPYYNHSAVRSCFSYTALDDPAMHRWRKGLQA